MATDITSPPGSASTMTHDPSKRPRLWWALTAVVACASLIIGATVQHFFDERAAARNEYKMQVLTTLSRFSDEEGRQAALPVAKRSAIAFGTLADSISQDQGVNGSGSLTVTLGAGSAGPRNQIAFAVTVASPYASTTIATWYISVTGHGGSSTNEGACVLSSTLLSPGRATADLTLGGGEFLQPCSAGWFSSGPVTPRQPSLGLAGISEPAAK